jgi:hypothetical protein
MAPAEASGAKRCFLNPIGKLPKNSCATTHWAVFILCLVQHGLRNPL